MTNRFNTLWNHICGFENAEKAAKVQAAAWEGLAAFKAIAAGVKISSTPVLHERTGIVVRDYGMSLKFGASLRPNVSLRSSMQNAKTDFFAKDLGGEIVAMQSNIVIDCKDLCMGEKQFKMDLQLFAEKKEEKAMVDIASANEELLMTLPGIGAEKAKAIVEYRNANGIRKAEDLLNIKGISAKKLALIMNLICVKGEDVMAQKIVQEFKASLNNNALLHEMKQGEGNGTVYKVSLFPTVDGFMAAKLAPTSVQITPVNKGFFKKNLKMQNVIGERTIVNLAAIVCAYWILAIWYLAPLMITPLLKRWAESARASILLISKARYVCLYPQLEFAVKMYTAIFRPSKVVSSKRKNFSMKKARKMEC